jgi:hypothetical protein
MTPETAFRLYITTKLHFTTDYDVFNAGGRLNWNPSRDNRKDLNLILPFVKKLTTEREMIELTAANMLYGYPTFLYDDPEEGFENFSQWNMVKQSFDHVLDRDLAMIEAEIDSGRCDSLEDFLQKRFISFVLSKKIQYESIIMINRHTPIYSMIDGFDSPKYIVRMDKANMFVKKGTLSYKHQSRIDNFFSNYKLRKSNGNTVRTPQISFFDV